MQAQLIAILPRAGRLEHIAERAKEAMALVYGGCKVADVHGVLLVLSGGELAEGACTLVSSQVEGTYLEKADACMLLDEYTSLEAGFTTSIRSLMREERGLLSLTIASRHYLAAARDPAGATPMYYASTPLHLAVSTSPLLLELCGFRSYVSIPAGCCLAGDRAGEVIAPLASLLWCRGEGSAREVLRKLRLQLSHVERAAVMFSGGLDSSVLAAAMRDSGCSIELYTCAAKGSADEQAALEAAEALGLKLNLVELSEQAVEDTLPVVLAHTCKPTLMDASIAVPLHLASREASSKGFKLSALGQGADELFGGYARFVWRLRESGPRGALDSIEASILQLQRGFERDHATVSAAGLELSTPYASQMIAGEALSAPLAMRVSADGSRKLLLREVARALGLPESIAERAKKAAQYGSMSEKLVRKAAEKRGYKGAREAAYYLRALSEEAKLKLVRELTSLSRFSTLSTSRVLS